MRRQLLHVLAAGACLATAYAQQNQNRPPQPNFDNVEIHVLPVQGDVYMLVGAGGNITLQVGKDGVLLVDTEYAQLSDKILAAIRKISDGPIRYIINTHYHPDHTSGNENLRKAGSTIAGGNVEGDLGAAAGEGAAIIAHTNVLSRMSAPTGSQAPSPSGGWPTSAYLGDLKKLWFNNEGIEIIHPEHAHTDGDSIVFFRKSDVISTGDIFTMTTYPIIDLPGGGSYQGLLDAVNRILDMTITVYGQDGGTLIVPGHGRLCDAGDLLNYREMVTIIRDRLVDMIKKGMTLEQVKAAKPTQDYDPLYGTSTGFWTTDMFVEAAYKSLSESRKK
jgi:glyoxylase-like metal-dependent hydrolase (beta-lactamase superfamily II)